MKLKFSGAMTFCYGLTSKCTYVGKELCDSTGLISIMQLLIQSVTIVDISHYTDHISGYNIYNTVNIRKATLTNIGTQKLLPLPTHSTFISCDDETATLFPLLLQWVGPTNSITHHYIAKCINPLRTE